MVDNQTDDAIIRSRILFGARGLILLFYLTFSALTYIVLPSLASIEYAKAFSQLQLFIFLFGGPIWTEAYSVVTGIRDSAQLLAAFVDTKVIDRRQAGVAALHRISYTLIPTLCGVVLWFALYPLVYAGDPLPPLTDALTLLLLLGDLRPWLGRWASAAQYLYLPSLDLHCYVLAALLLAAAPGRKGATLVMGVATLTSVVARVAIVFAGGIHTASRDGGLRQQLIQTYLYSFFPSRFYSYAIGVLIGLVLHRKSSSSLATDELPEDISTSHEDAAAGALMQGVYKVDPYAALPSPEETSHRVNKNRLVPELVADVVAVGIFALLLYLLDCYMGDSPFMDHNPWPDHASAYGWALALLPVAFTLLFAVLLYLAIGQHSRALGWLLSRDLLRRGGRAFTATYVLHGHLMVAFSNTVGVGDIRWSLCFIALAACGAATASFFVGEIFHTVTTRLAKMIWEFSVRRAVLGRRLEGGAGRRVWGGRRQLHPLLAQIDQSSDIE